MAYPYYPQAYGYAIAPPVFFANADPMTPAAFGSPYGAVAPTYAGPATVVQYAASSGASSSMEAISAQTRADTPLSGTLVGRFGLDRKSVV